LNKKRKQSIEPTKQQPPRTEKACTTLGDTHKHTHSAAAAAAVALTLSRTRP